MRISQKTEWALIAGLILYMAFMSGFQPVRELLGSGVGKAIGLAAVVATWKYVSPIVAILLSIEFVRVAILREHATNQSGTSGSTTTTTTPSMGPPPAMPTTPPPAPPTASTIPSTCPDGFTAENGICKNKSTDQTVPMIAGPPQTSTTTMRQGFTTMTPAAAREGFQPNDGKKDNFASF
jgi:hypothetical protein